MLPTFTVIIMWTMSICVLIIIISALPTSVKFVEWISKPNNWLVYGISVVIFLLETDLVWAKHWSGGLACFVLFFYLLVDNKNSKEGQVTFLWTNFIRKSYENPLTARGEFIPSSTQHTTKAELRGDRVVLSENQFHPTAPFP